VEKSNSKIWSISVIKNLPKVNNHPRKFAQSGHPVIDLSFIEETGSLLEAGDFEVHECFEYVTQNF
jgi:hypothetical protein